MAVDIKVPDMGESVVDATITNWLKKTGDHLAAGDPVVELETDKVSLEVGAPQAGILQEILHQAGDTVAVGDVLARLAPEGEQLSADQKTAPDVAVQKSPTHSAVPQPAAQERENGGKRATPLAQRVAQEMGVDLKSVPPSGSGGRITREDVEVFAAKGSPEGTGPKPSAHSQETPGAAAPAPAPAPAAAPVPQSPARPGSIPPANEVPASRGEERVRMTRRRQTIARRMVEAQQTAAMLTTFNEIDMTAVMDLRKRRREAFKERFGVDLGYMSFFVKASIGALKAFPYVNAEIQGEEIVVKHYYDIGIAIGAEEGLVVPVIRDADRLNFAGIESAIRAFAEKVKQNTLGIDDLRGGTFTITNGGVYGSLMSTPILNPPQVGILGMHAIKDRPVALGGQVVIRPMMYVALSYDHRIVDGRKAVQFLVRIKELIEDPESLLLG